MLTIGRLGAIAAWGLLAWSALDQPDQPAAAPRGLSDDDLAPLVAALDSADAAGREQATQLLAADHPDARLKDLERALARADLSTEQRRRLLAASFQRFRAEPRAAMGVQFDPAARESGMRLNLVVAGFHAAEVLRAGDRVLTFDGTPVRDQEHAVCLIVARDPGDEVELSIVRAGAPEVIRVRLGRRDALETPSLINPAIIARAWTIRANAVTAPERETPIIDSGLPAAAWAPTAAPTDEDAAWASAGGEPRAGPGPDTAAVPQGNVADMARGNPRVRIIDGRPAGLRRDANQLNLERRSMQSLVTGLQQAIDLYDRELRRADLQVHRRQEVQLQLEFARMQLTQTLERIREIERDLARLGAAPNGRRGGP